MKFDTSILVATLAASAVAAPAPFPGVAKRWVVSVGCIPRFLILFSTAQLIHFQDTTDSQKLPAHFAPTVRQIVKEKAMNKRQLDQLLGGLLGGAGGAGAAGGAGGAAGGLGGLLGGAGGAGAAGGAGGAAGGLGALLGGAGGAGGAGAAGGQAGGLGALLGGLGAGGANGAASNTNAAAGAATSATAGAVST